MALINVKAKNFKQHADIDFDLDGKSIVLLGDTGKGKTNFMNLVLAHLGIIDYPKDAQKEGADSGLTETTLDINGIKYVIKREFKNGKLSRFRMTADGRTVTWETEIRKIFNGLSPATSFFDYSKFFFELRTAAKRFEYMVQCAIGPTFFENKKLIDDETEERGKLGSQKKLFESRLATSDLNADNYKSMLEYFDKPHPTDDAEKAKAEILSKRGSAVEVSQELAGVKNDNHITNQAIEYKSNFENSILGINDRIADMEAQIKKAQAEKEELEGKILRCNERIANVPVNKEREEELQSKLDTIEADNKKIEEDADATFKDLMKDVEIFNTKREKFFNDKKDLDEWMRLQSEWEELDDSIKAKKQENIALFKQKLPLPELEIKETWANPNDPNSKVQYELLYNGREVSFDAMSKGETLRFALLVQQALSPDSLKLIFIPEGQSMGSGLDEVLEVAREHGIQTVVEITERKHNFEIKFEEEWIK